MDEMDMMDRLRNFQKLRVAEKCEEIVLGTCLRTSYPDTADTGT